MNQRRFFLGLLQRRECVLPSARGWIALLLAGALAILLVGKYQYAFLATTDSVPGGILVVEGWAPDYALAATLEEWRRHHYEKLYVTGGPLEEGSPLAQYGTCAHYGAAILQKLGGDKSYIEPVASGAVVKDRTYASAITLKKWLIAHGTMTDKVNVVSLGPHSRRSRLLFQKAFGSGVHVGVIAVRDLSFAPEQWWRSSGGVRATVDETVAYLYARILFRAPPDE